MSSLPVEVVGSAAGFLTTASFVPQVAKILRERKTEAISLPMYIAFTVGVFLWLVYGVLLHSYSIAVTNFITLALASAVLVLKIAFERRAISSDHADL